MSSKRKLTPQEEARLSQVRENFQKRKKITESISSVIESPKEDSNDF